MGYGGEEGKRLLSFLITRAEAAEGEGKGGILLRSLDGVPKKKV